jgi:adenylate cyclase class 2
VRGDAGAWGLTPRPAANVEFKARAGDLAAVARRALALGAVAAGTLRQRDTYFAVPDGRLKLREETTTPPDGGAPTSHAELIAYRRADERRARVSTYERRPVEDAPAAASELDAQYGRTVVVTKVRRLLTWRGVRIHLDDVAGLGTFVELEGVVVPDLPVDACAERVDALRRGLGIEPTAVVADGYAALLSRSVKST